jgi:hypothetical protein
MVFTSRVTWHQVLKGFAGAALGVVGRCGLQIKASTGRRLVCYEGLIVLVQEGLFLGEMTSVRRCAVLNGAFETRFLRLIVFDPERVKR